MSRILYIETATDVCSVTLADGDQILESRETTKGKSHAKILTVFIDKILQEAKEAPEAIAVSKGPGSYTGLRIGVSAAKGLCYGLNIPLIAVPTLESMCLGFIKEHPNLPPDALLAPMLDARRMEVYTALFSSRGELINPTSALVVDKHSFSDLADQPLYLFGSGADKLENVVTHPHVTIIKDFRLSAEFMIEAARKRFESKSFEDVAYFEPFYLKDFITTTPKKNILG